MIHFGLLGRSKRFTAGLLTAALLLSQPVIGGATESPETPSENIVTTGEALPAADIADEGDSADTGIELGTDTVTISDEDALSDEYVIEEGTAEGAGFVSEGPAPEEETAAVDAEDSVPVLGDDSDMEDDEDDLGQLKFDKYALVTALSGIECNEAVFNGVIALNKNQPSVKLAWKVDGARYYSLDCFLVDGSHRTLVVRTKKKNYIDMNAFDLADSLHVYRLTAFDAMGAKLGEYVTVPSVYVLSADNGVTSNSNKLVFAQLGKHFKYTVERSEKKKFEVDKSFTAIDSRYADGRDEKLYSFGTAGTVLTMSSLAVSDSDSMLGENKANYYRIKTVLDVDGLDIFSAFTKSVTVKNAKYPAPIISRISRYFNDSDADENEKVHDMCADNGNFYVRFEGGLKSDIDIAEAEIVIYRAGMNGRYKKITSEYIDDLQVVKVSSLDGKSTISNYVVPYDNFPPEEVCVYKAAVSYKGMSAFSEPFQRVCHFNDVEVVSAGEHAYNSVKLKWKSDPCATRYNIYRSIDTWDDLQAAEDAMEKLEKDRFKKIKTVKNTTPREGTEIEFVDSRALEVGMYHIYRIVPSNKKEADFYTKSKPMALKAYPASPEEVFVYPVNRHTMDIVWSAANNAVVYKIQRTDTISGGVPIFSEEKGVEFKEWEYNVKSSKAIKKVKSDDYITDDFGEKCEGYNYITVSVDDDDGTQVQMGKQYYYRVVAACKVGQAVIWADEESANWTEAHTQLAPVRDMTSTLYSKSSTDSTNVVQIGFKSAGKENRTRIEDIYDYQLVDHYEVVTATSERGLDTASVMTIDGKVFSYTEGSTTKSINIIDAPDTVMFKNVRKIKRGQAYYMGVRSVYKDGDKEIYGNWLKKKFVLPVEVYVYPEGSSRKATNSDKARYEIPSGTSKTFILDFDPYDTTYTDVDITLTTEEGSAFTKSYDPKLLTKNGYHYFTVTAPTVLSTSTVIPKTKITVTAKKKDAVGDVKTQLIKYYYIKAKKASSTTT